MSATTVLVTHPLIFALKGLRDAWGMEHAQLARVLHMDAATLTRWLDEPFESPATVPPGLETVPPLLAIQRRLESRHPGDQAAQAKWLTTPHPDFGGHAPVDIAATSHENLLWLAYYLESSR